MLLSVFAHVSNYRHVCLVSHTSCSFEPFLFSCLNAKSSSDWIACRISHPPLIWLTVSFVLPNHKQFIQVNRMLCIAHASIWLLVSFVPPDHKQFIELNHMPFIAHATKTWTVFDASVIANVLHISDGWHTTPFAIMASHTVSRRVSDHSVTLAASCSSVGGHYDRTWALGVSNMRVCFMNDSMIEHNGLGITYFSVDILKDMVACWYA